MRINEILTEGKIKGADGKACWKGYRYAGTEDGKDKCVKANESYDESEYDMEGDYVKNQLHTIRRMADILEKHLEDSDNLPEWMQEKISRAEGMLVGVADYWISELEQDVEQVAGVEGITLEETLHGDSFFESYGWVPETLEEAEYRGRKVQLNKPMQGDVKKFKVYVKDPKTGNIKKVNFGDPNMRIKKSNPARRKSFRARHNCDNPGPKTKARYWSCRKW